MLPLFGDHQRRREINLGGPSSASSYSTILEQAKARRLEREALRKREESAVKIQSWWRGTVQAQETRQHLRQLFQEDVSSLTSLRCFLLIGQDEDLLGQWSTSMVKNKCVLSKALASQDKEHWVVLLCHISELLLRCVANAPLSPFAIAHLQALCLILTPSTTPANVEGPPDPSISIARYVLVRGFYEKIHRAMMGIALESKHHPALPYLVHLLSLSFNTVPKSQQSAQHLQNFVAHILSIPLLPYRIPLTSLTQLSAQLPLEHLYTLTPSIADLVAQTSTTAQLNIIANLLVFAPHSRYASMPPSSLIVFIRLLGTLLSALPLGVLDLGLDAQVEAASWEDDNEHPSADTALQSIFSSVDKRTQRKLQEIMSPAYLDLLLRLTQQYPQLLSDVLCLLMILNISWPTLKHQVFNTLLLYNGGGIARQIYREYVRQSPLGCEKNLMDPSFGPCWPPLLLLTDLYSHALCTMGDDEFFSAPRALLPLDDLVSFSHTLFDIVFVLYRRDDICDSQRTNLPGLNLHWINVREKITKCLLAVHARDSRRPFIPKDHWNLDLKIDMGSFIEAAVYDSDKGLETDNSYHGSKHRHSRLTPRLGILNNIPFAIPFETRVHIFRRFIENDKGKHHLSSLYHHQRVELEIRRRHIAQDGYDKLSGIDLRTPVSITFIDRFGNPEAGIDGGGVFKEFYTSLCKEVFDTDRGLWLENASNEIYPNPHSYAKESYSLSWYRFIGGVVGKALYDGILVEVAFAGFFLAKWLDRESYLDDLASLDPELYQGLIFLKNYTGNVEDLSLNFTTVIEEFGLNKTVDLIPNGSNVQVTRDNRLQYIDRVSRYKLTKQIKLQSEAFFEGLSRIIDPKWLRMFNQQELQILLGGVNTPIDLSDLREHTQYGGLYDDGNPTIQAFWKVMESFDQEQRRAFLRFVTSCSRPPLLGFEQLRPNFAIRDAGDDEHRLPTASTCVNLLKLPRYTSERVLKQKLLQSISSGAGFDLS